MAKLRINLQHFTLWGFECAKFALTKIKIPWLFILYYPRLALLCFAKLGCGSVIKIKIPWLFILYYPRLALTLHLKQCIYSNETRFNFSYGVFAHGFGCQLWW